MLFSHFFAAFPIDSIQPLIKTWPVSILIDGAAAVCLFFVLSGYVLARKYFDERDKVRELNLFTYLVGRICRIWLPFAVVILISWLIRKHLWDGYGSYASTSEWFTRIWSETCNLGELVKQLCFGQVAEAKQLVPQGWTLREEMKFSFLLPILVLIASRGFSWVVFFAALLIGILGQSHFTFHFCMGVGLAFYEERVSRWFKKLSLVHALLLVNVGLLLYGNRGWLPLQVGIRTEEITAWFLSALGGMILVAAALNIPAIIRLLSGKILTYGGLISYGFYLCHLAVVIMLSHWSASRISSAESQDQVLIWLGVLCVNFIACLAVSTVFYQVVERPSIMLAKKLSQVWSFAVTAWIHRKAP